MARGLVFSEGIGNISYPCINGTTAALVAGRPLMRKGLCNFEGAVVYGRGGAALGEFAGVLTQKLEYNGVADVSSSKLKREGKMRATIRVHATPANYIAGCWLAPKYSSTNGAYFEQTARITGIRLLENWTAKTASTLYTVESGAGGMIFIEPGVGYYSGRLHYLWHAPAVGSATYFLSGQATSASVVTTVLAASMLNSATPDYARNVVITPGGTTADVPAGDVTVTGLNIYGVTITETFTFAANASGAVTGNKAFASITSVAFPIQDGGAATYSVGTGAKLGLGRCFPVAPMVLQSKANGTVEGTAPTLAIDVDDVCSNTIQFNTALNGSDMETVILAA